MEVKIKISKIAVLFEKIFNFFEELSIFVVFLNLSDNYQIQGNKVNLKP